MRILKLAIYYPAYLQRFYGDHPARSQQDYATQHAAFMQDAFGSADFWTAALAELGHVTADLILNAEPLQRAWARENGVPFAGSDWLFTVASAQIQRFKPDILFVADYSTVTYGFLRKVQEECPSIRRTLIWCGAPYGDARVFHACDLVLSCVPELVDGFRAQGLPAEHLHHAFAPRVLEDISLATAPPAVDFSFLGSVVLADSFHRPRARLLAELVRETSLEIWANLDKPPITRRAAQQARRLAFDTVDRARRIGLPQEVLARIPLVGRVARWTERPRVPEAIDPRVRGRAHRALFGLAMFSRMRTSRVTLNTHIEISRRNASNMRLFEATGVGACLLTDRKDNLAELFEPDREVVTYDSASECVEKARYLLAHESERAAIAAAGQRRTLRDHTFTSRAAQLDAIIRKALANPASAKVDPGPLPAGRKVASSFEEVEQAERRFYLDSLREGMTVFDVGAHVGELTQLFSRCVGSGRVHAFEAGKTSFARLSQAVGAAGLGNVLLHHVAMSDREGEIELHVYDDAHLAWSTQAQRPLASYGIDVKPVGIERIEAITLDGYCETAGIAAIDLLKIDVEGAELQVLLGARRLLAEQRIRCLTFEFGQTTFDMGNSAEEIEALLEEHGYTIRNLIAGEVPFPGRESARSAQFAMHVATVGRHA